MNQKFYNLFGQKPIIGMIHTNSDIEKSVLELARTEIEIYLRHGICPLIENYFGSEDDCEEVLDWIHAVHRDAIYGVNILGDFPYAFDLAKKYGAKFIQIDSVSGHNNPKDDAQFARCLDSYRSLSDSVILGGVRFKYQPVNSGRSLKEDLLIGMERCDAIVCTGSGTGKNTPMEKVNEFKEHLGNFPVIVGAGVTQESAKCTFDVADGAIVGSWFKCLHKDYNMVNEKYVQDFVNEVRNQ